MFQVQQLTHFGVPAAAASPQLPPAALPDAPWARTTDDPLFIEIIPAAMGYRSAPRGFAGSGSRRGKRRGRA
jgi:hypothetical protein